MHTMHALLQTVRDSIDRGDITMSSLARDVGCSRQHIHGILQGKHKLSLEMAESLAAALGMELRLAPIRKKKSA